MSEQTPKQDDHDELITKLMKKTQANSVDGLAGKVYVRTKTVLGIGHVFRRGVPALLKGFEMKDYAGKRQRCVVAKYKDGVEYWLPVGALFRSFEFIDDEAEEMTVTWIPKKQLEKGF